MSSTRRPFRIEMNPVQPSGSELAAPIPVAAPAPAPSSTAGPIATQVERIFDELQALRDTLARFNRNRSSEVAQNGPAKSMWLDIEAIREAIDSTKHELASIQTTNVKGAQFNRATDELDAVIADTEAATEDILQMAENIDGAAASLIEELEGSKKATARAIQTYATRIFEACNFQDISGQRIRKVVQLMIFIEEKMARMAEIWGAEQEIARIAEEIGDTREGDAALLNGPALADEVNVVSQNDIDSLFA